ncbi:Predicted Peptidoglycan domain-containing protein [Flavobacterium gillisiae]|uniref:Predicted Peptidoglycan domain-containing protein n=1 Tax=Flavobacterium gillisiae TaxID=150146 RepID=A0A1H3WUD6_9FLAO|nr:glycosyl hydrolase 108 family protein [Flavobacterium gillisiae]SDZ90765.1 Predicted Peptidoglycan domain-containing protein [Flavobacterium gillisiae]
MANFNLFIPILQKIEGGFQQLTKDKGNYNSLGINVGTNYGISARFYEGIIGRPPTVADMKAITKLKAQALYKKYFWDDVQGDKLKNQSIANIITDHAVNAGESPIGTIVQRILRNDFKKNVTIDGDIGPLTAIAINSVNQELLFNKIKAARASHYYSMGGEFLNSWLNRLKSFSYTKNASPSGQVA